MNSEVNNTPNHTVKKNISDKNVEVIPAASYYALKLAFQSIKERYDKLQDRLYALEEENVKLKEIGNNKQVHNGSGGCSRMEILEKKIDELSRQKSQLSHHIFMLANENKDLWSNISKLTEEKQILVKQLRDLIDKTDGEQKLEKLPDSLQQQDNTQAPLEVASCSEDPVKEASTSDEDNKDSLQSLETVKDFSLIQLENQEDLTDSLNDELKEILNKMNEDKVELQQQQAKLKESLAFMKRLYQGLKMYLMYLHNLKSDQAFSSSSQKTIAIESDDRNNCGSVQELISEVEEIDSKGAKQRCENNVVNIIFHDEIICPFCGKLFSKTIGEEEFNKQFFNHVQNCKKILLNVDPFEGLWS
ncbi:uncharacterized protein [Rhodnius prolixus]|uniref:uncharacterized protein n=1 Tax=Rhodnius prolixus TaxID=13249 RepID=UPI003D189077